MDGPAVVVHAAGPRGVPFIAELGGFVGADVGGLPQVAADVPVDAFGGDGPHLVGGGHAASTRLVTVG